MDVLVDGIHYFSNLIPIYITNPIGWDFFCPNPSDVKCTEIVNTHTCMYL